MANETKGVIHQQETEKFMGKLFKFHQQNGSPIRRIPTLGGRELDLYHLYEKVKSLGGSAAVSSHRMWGEVARSFNLPPSVTSASYAIRQHYTKLLENFEAYESDPNFTDFFHMSSTTSLSPHPLTITHTPSQPRTITRSLTQPSASTLTPSQPHSSLSSKPFSTLSSSLRTSSNCDSVEGVRGCERLVRSLMSGYPNEVDFAFNILTIMSKNDALPILELPHLLDVMLAHVAVFSEDDYGLETVYHEWCKDSTTNFHEFWEESVPVWIHDNLFSHDAKKAPTLPTLFTSKRLPSETNVECYRVSQLLTILSNLSFKEPCAHHFSRHDALLRFLLLCVNNVIPEVRSLSLDLLTNLAPHILLPSHLHSSPLTELLMASVHFCILSNDKLSILRGLETLGELGWCLENESMLSETPQEVFKRLFELLLLTDVQLVLTTIDTLYNLTLFGGEIALNIASVDKCFEILVNLLVLKIESFGSDSLARVKLIQHNPPLKQTSQQQQQQQQQQHLISRLLSLQLPTTTTKRTGSESSTPLLVANPNSNLVVANAIQGLNISTRNRTGTANNKVLSQHLKIGNSIVPTIPNNVSSPLTHKPPTTNQLSSLPSSSPAAVLTDKQLHDLLVKKIPAGSQQLMNLFGLSSLVAQSASKTASTLRNNITSTANMSNALTQSLKSLVAAKSADRKQSTPSPTEALVERSTSSVGQLTSSTLNKGVNGVSSSSTLSGQSTPTSVEGVASPPPQYVAAAAPLTGDNRKVSSGDSSKQVQSKLEEFTGVWLKTYYKASPQKYINLGDMHCLYLLACSECGRTDPLTLGGFESHVRKVFPGTLTSHITVGENTVIMVAGLERQVLPVSVLRPPLSTPPTLMTPPTISSSQSNGVIPQRTTVPLTPAAVTHGLTQLKMGVRGVVRKNSAIEDNSSGELWRTKRIKLDSETESLAVSTDSKLSPATLIADSRTTSTLLVPGTQHEPTATHSRLNLSHRASRSPSEPTSSGDQLRGNSLSTRDSTPLSASSSSQQLSQRSSPVSSLTSSSSSRSPSREIMNPSLLSGSMNITSSTVVCNVECQWSTCTNLHASWDSLFYHVVYDHVPTLSSFPAVCQWRNCTNKVKRMRPSLVRHLQTHHCTSESKPSPPNVSRTLSKLRSLPPFENETESPLTKAVRLTAALVLRNLVKLLPEARRRLLPYESRLCQVSMSNSEASCAVSQCLYYLHH